jgi:hypothetical protein
MDNENLLLDKLALLQRNRTWWAAQVKGNIMTDWKSYKIPDDDWNAPWSEIDALFGRILNGLAVVGMFCAFVALCFAWGYLT